MRGKNAYIESWNRGRKDLGRKPKKGRMLGTTSDIRNLAVSWPPLYRIVTGQTGWENKGDPRWTETNVPIARKKDFGSRTAPRDPENRRIWGQKPHSWPWTKTREVTARSPHPEPRITLQVGRQPVTFLVDTGVQHSVLTRSPGPLSNQTAWVQGATG